jgi:predicted porin
MKQTLLAIALVGAFGAAHAQSSVSVYGVVDAGLIKKTDSTLAIGKRDSNRLGFKGVEDLGEGLKALFQLEIRYEPDTGTNETGANFAQRPLFQGQSRVGLQGAFGTVRVGRGTTAMIDSIDAFDPWNGIPTPAGFKTDLSVAGYTSDPLSPAGNSANRFSNGAFYNSPVIGGFQVNTSVGTKEANNGPAIIGTGTAAAPQYPANAEASTTPFSISATYTGGAIGAMLAYERNAIETKMAVAGVSLMVTPSLKLMASHARQDKAHTMLSNPKTKAWVLGANYTVGAGKVLIGYGQKSPDGVAKTKEASLGYEYSLSKRTYLYVDASSKKAPTEVKYYNIGMRHAF